MIPKRRIYLSTPLDNHLTADQLAMKKAIVAAMVNEDLEPQEFLASGLPMAASWGFEKANEIMRRCDGAAILAFVRWHWQLVSGDHLLMPSEYNHYEGALAVANSLPILIIAEEGMPDRGIVWRGGGLLINFISSGASTAWAQNAPFKNQFQAWLNKVKSRPRVFLGYCSQAKPTADAITLFLEHTLKVSVRNYAMDFIAGGTILEEIQRACRDCTCGIFLFTKDDPLVSQNPFQAAPRDNVVFEAGYFMQAKGKERTLIIREDGAKMPADLGGNIYLQLPDRHNISSIQLPLTQFLEDRL